MAQHQSKLIQHLGIIAELCNEVKLAEKIDQLMPENKRAVSIGKTVQAMIINALGYAGRALYLTKRFFVNRPVEQLVGPDVTSNQLNDSALGTALDSIFEYGVTELFFQVASKILQEQGIETRFAHLDSTTFTLHGEYNSDGDEVPEGVIHIVVFPTITKKCWKYYNILYCNSSHSAKDFKRNSISRKGIRKIMRQISIRLSSSLSVRIVRVFQCGLKL